MSSFKKLLLIFLLLTPNLFFLSSCSCICGTHKSNFVRPSLAEAKANFKKGKYTLAYRQLLPRAVKGNIDAQYAIGYMYLYGKGIDANEELAENWLRKAAVKGQPQAIALMKRSRIPTA
jgi:TPR repeat protein